MSIVAVSLYFVPWLILQTYFSPLPSNVQAQADEAIERQLGGIIIYIQQGNQAPELYASGWKDREAKTPADPHAYFKIASISKLYIAAAVAKLVEAGTLSLDDTLAQLLPDIANHFEYANKITLRMLVQHRSGIPNHSDAEGFPWFEPPQNAQDALAFAYDKPAEFVPGTDYQYCNTNYILIGEIIDRALGYRYQDYIQQHIVKPLGLSQTFGSMEPLDQDEIVSGYIKGYDGPLTEINYVTAPGSMVATISDVGVFIRALNKGQLFTPAEQAIYDEIYVRGHTGLLPGYSSIARYHPSLDTVVVQFVNTSGGYSWNVHEIIYNRVVEILTTRL